MSCVKSWVRELDDVAYDSDESFGASLFAVVHFFVVCHFDANWCSGSGSVKLGSLTW